MRVLFQILMAMATHITEESTTRNRSPNSRGENRRASAAGRLWLIPILPTANAAQVNSGSMAQFAFPWRTRRQIHCGMLRKQKGAEMPDVFFFGHYFADHSGDKSDQRRGRTGEPFVIAKSRETDQRAAQQANDAAADETHEEGAFEGEIEEAVADEAQHDADGQRRRQEKQEHHFLVGVADFGEEQLAERAEADEQCCQ